MIKLTLCVFIRAINKFGLIILFSTAIHILASDQKHSGAHCTPLKSTDTAPNLKKTKTKQVLKRWRTSRCQLWKRESDLKMSAVSLVNLNDKIYSGKVSTFCFDDYAVMFLSRI